MGFLKLLVPAAASCSCNALANMFWKMRFDKTAFSLRSVQDFVGIITSPFIWFGVMCYGCSMMLFFFMLSNFKLSAIMPVTCLTNIFNIIIAKVVFHEPVSHTQLVGTAVVICGLLILSRGQ